MDEIRFLQKVLEFFNFNVSLAKRDSKSFKRLKLFMGIIPSFKELSEVFKHYALEFNVRTNRIKFRLLSYFNRSCWSTR